MALFNRQRQESNADENDGTRPDGGPILNALREVIDPEIGINVVDLGLVYGVEEEKDRVRVVMTMTTPACPLGSYVTEMARHAVRGVVGETTEVEVALVWDPPWSPERMSEQARRQLGWL